MSQASRRSFGRLVARAMASAWVRHVVRVAMLFIAACAGIICAAGLLDAEIPAGAAEGPIGISAPSRQRLGLLVRDVCGCQAHGEKVDGSL
jgi:hypothetical protein